MAISEIRGSRGPYSVPFDVRPPAENWNFKLSENTDTRVSSTSVESCSTAHNLARGADRVRGNTIETFHFHTRYTSALSQYFKISNGEKRESRKIKISLQIEARVAIETTLPAPVPTRKQGFAAVVTHDLSMGPGRVFDGIDRRR